MTGRFGGLRTWIRLRKASEKNFLEFAHTSFQKSTEMGKDVHSIAVDISGEDTMPSSTPVSS